MRHESLKEEILHKLDQLPTSMQRRVLFFADALLQSEPKGVPGRDLLEFAGILSKEDADAIEAAIEEGCEQIVEDEVDEW